MIPYDPLDPQADTFRPPTIPVLVACLHCGQEYDSYRMEWRIRRAANGQLHGFWCCPIPGCDGKGFGCDVFPVDPNYRDEYGDKMYDEDEEEEGAIEEEWLAGGGEKEPGAGEKDYLPGQEDESSP